MDQATDLIFYKKSPFAVKLLKDEIEFLDENFDDLFDGITNIRARQAFMKLVEKALSNIKANNKSLPSDLQLISDLESELKQAKQHSTTVSAQLNDLVSIKERLEKELDETKQLLEVAKDTIEDLRLTEPEIKEIERQIERPLRDNERLLVLSPLENYALTQIERVHKTDAHDILINRFFMVYQKRGNGDYDIKRISPDSLKVVEQTIKQAQTNG